MNREKGMPVYQAIRCFLASPGGKAAAFCWGMLEASVFFVIPDVYLGFAALFFPFYGFVLCAVAVAGALVGGGCMYYLAQIYPAGMVGLLHAIPGISWKMIEAVQVSFAENALKALFLAPWEGVPYKIYAVQAGIAKIDFLPFLMASVPARLERFILVLIAAALLGRVFRARIARYPRRWIFLYALLWVVLYTRYAFFVRARWGG